MCSGFEGLPYATLEKSGFLRVQMGLGAKVWDLGC